MNVYELIKKKRDGYTLTPEEIEFLVSGYVTGTIPDYQFSAFLMSVYFAGMNTNEILALTKALLKSGTSLDLSSVPGPKIDKHSTGGVGDKVSIILAPLVAACGVVVPMISGHSLGHTGGTLDKLESIPGFRTNLSSSEFIRNLSRIGVAVAGQSSEIVPADKKIYSLRDVTATVDSIPLIAASIMSKKLAEGIQGLVLDVKTGSGAFMRERAHARRLAQTMIAIGKKMGTNVTVLITGMDQPLGRAVGNSLEIVEAIHALRGNGPRDLIELTYALGVEMLVMAGMAKEFKEGMRRLTRSIADGSALDKFRLMVKFQGGDERIIDDMSLLPTARFVDSVRANQSGWISKIDTTKIGLLLIELGGGRKKIGDTIDPAVGFIFEKKLCQRVKRGEVIVKIFANDQLRVQPLTAELAKAITVSSSPQKTQPLIVERVN